MDGRTDSRRKSSRVVRQGGDELSQATGEWPRRDYRARPRRPHRHRPQHPAHGLGIQDNQAARSRYRAQRALRYGVFTFAPAPVQVRVTEVQGWIWKTTPAFDDPPIDVVPQTFPVVSTMRFSY